MKLHFWAIGKTHESYVREGIDMFTKRITNYFPVQWQLIPVPRNMAAACEKELKIKEASLILNLLKKEDYLILLDERGKQFSSESLSVFLQQRFNESKKNVVFLIGGAYGVDESVSERADHTWSLSQLVFPHQLVRLILSEQIYRACTILRNEKYHHS